MPNLYILPFILFIPLAWLYYRQKMNRQDAFFSNQRNDYILAHPELTEAQEDNLKNSLPWTGMKTDLLIELFGEPQRKRVLDQSVTRFIWTYSDLFVYVTGDAVAEWKKR